MSVDWLALRGSAERARASAYAPYSQFRVGAAVLAADGRVFAGCNVENASFGLSICAERNAIFQAVASGARSFLGLAVASSAPEPVTPCGACRQVLAEFGPPFEIYCVGSDGALAMHTTDALLPHAFRARDFVQKP